MRELSTDNAADFLREKGWIGPGPVQIDYLGGGVSNLVLRVATPERTFVLKQSRPQLRTKAAWFSNLDRIYREQEVMEALHPLLPPLVVPEVLFSDRDNFVFAMSHAPANARVWKEALLAGEIDEKVGELAGHVLGRMHQASAENPQFAERFGDPTIFEQLRIEPFYRTVQRNRPEVAVAIEPIIGRLYSTKEALCHGDYTPKNILTHEHGFTLVDYETAYFGDPTMDVGLFLCHLVLKWYHKPVQYGAYLELIRGFWNGYVQQIRFSPPGTLEPRAIEHLAVCLLARIDGTSPVDYLKDNIKAHVRRDAIWILGAKPKTLESVLGEIETTIFGMR